MIISNIPNKYFFNIIPLMIVVSFIIASHNIPRAGIIAYVDLSKNIHFTDEFMSGGEDFVPFAVGRIIFLPTLIEMFLSIILKKERAKTRLILLFFSIGLQSILLYIWIDSANIILNLLYGNIFLRAWIICFITIVIYFFLLLFCSLRVKIGGHNEVK